jgi:hypothetical protein
MFMAGNEVILQELCVKTPCIVKMLTLYMYIYISTAKIAANFLQTRSINKTIS